MCTHQRTALPPEGQRERRSSALRPLPSMNNHLRQHRPGEARGLECEHGVGRRRALPHHPHAHVVLAPERRRRRRGRLLAPRRRRAAHAHRARPGAAAAAPAARRPAGRAARALARAAGAPSATARRQRGACAIVALSRRCRLGRCRRGRLRRLARLRAAGQGAPALSRRQVSGRLRRPPHAGQQRTVPAGRVEGVDGVPDGRGRAEVAAPGWVAGVGTWICYSLALPFAGYCCAAAGRAGAHAARRGVGAGGAGGRVAAGAARRGRGGAQRVRLRKRQGLRMTKRTQARVGGRAIDVGRPVRTGARPRAR